VGNDDNSPMNRVTGGTLPTRIWRDVMEPAHEGLPRLPLPGEHDMGEQSLGPLAANQEIDLPSDEQKNEGFFGSLEEFLGGRSRPAGQSDGKRKSSFDKLRERSSNR